jgi:hypothetical protein
VRDEHCFVPTDGRAGVLLVREDLVELRRQIIRAVHRQAADVDLFAQVAIAGRSVQVVGRNRVLHARRDHVRIADEQRVMVHARRAGRVPRLDRGANVRARIRTRDVLERPHGDLEAARLAVRDELREFIGVCLRRDDQVARAVRLQIGREPSLRQFGVQHGVHELLLAIARDLRERLHVARMQELELRVHVDLQCARVRRPLEGQQLTVRRRNRGQQQPHGQRRRGDRARPRLRLFVDDRVQHPLLRRSIRIARAEFRLRVVGLVEFGDRRRRDQRHGLGHRLELVDLAELDRPDSRRDGDDEAGGRQIRTTFDAELRQAGERGSSSTTCHRDRRPCPRSSRGSSIRRSSALGPRAAGGRSSIRQGFPPRHRE